MSVLTLSSMSDGLRVRDASLVVFCGAMPGNARSYLPLLSFSLWDSRAGPTSTTDVVFA